MRIIKKLVVSATVFLTVALAGCHHEPVHHLVSDACLLSPGVSPQEVVTYLGVPQERRLGEQGNEVWVYYAVHKSFLRDTPFIGEKFGDKDYELVTVTFLNNAVSTCVYHSYTEEEIARLGLIIPDEK